MVSGWGLEFGEIHTGEREGIFELNGKFCKSKSEFD